MDFLSQMVPAVKPTMDRFAQSMDAMATSLQQIEQNTAPTPRPEKEAKFLPLPLAAATQRLNVARLILSVDTAGLYHLQLGTYNVMDFQLAIGAVVIDLTGTYLSVGRGTPLALVADVGTPKISATAVAFGA